MFNTTIEMIMLLTVVVVVNDVSEKVCMAQYDPCNADRSVHEKGVHVWSLFDIEMKVIYLMPSKHVNGEPERLADDSSSFFVFR